MQPIDPAAAELIQQQLKKKSEDQEQGGQRVRALRVVARIWTTAVAEQRKVVELREAAWAKLFDHTDKQREDRERERRGEKLTPAEKRRKKKERKRVLAETGQQFSQSKRDLENLRSTVGIIEEAVSLKAILSTDDRSIAH